MGLRRNETTVVRIDLLIESQNTKLVTQDGNDKILDLRL